MKLFPLLKSIARNNILKKLGCLIFLHEPIMSEILYHAGDAARKAFLYYK